MNIDIARRAVGSLGVAILSLACVGSPALAAPETRPSGSPVTNGCPTVAPRLVDDIDDAFAYDLTSPAIQRFIALLGSASHRAQAEVVERATSATRSRTYVEVVAELANVCLGAPDAVGYERAIGVIAHVWSASKLRNQSAADTFAFVLETAVSALAHPDALTPEERAAAAAPFQSLEQAAPAAAATGTSGCADPDTSASAVFIPSLSYPSVARRSRSTGTILVKLALSETGGVRSATLFQKKTKGSAAGVDALVEAAIVVAAASTYEPDREKCAPRAGGYLFKANFDPN